MDRDDFNNQGRGGFYNQNNSNGYNNQNSNPYFARNNNASDERRGFIDPGNPLGVPQGQQNNGANNNFSHRTAYNPQQFGQAPMQGPIPQYVPQPRPMQPQQPVPQMYEQTPNQISPDDFEDQFDYQRGQVRPMQGQMPMQQQPYPQQNYAQPQKKKGLFSFMNKSKPQQEQPEYYSNTKQYLNIQTPQNADDMRTIIDMIKSGDTVIVDFSRANEKDHQRMVDYLAGAMYALKGLMRPMGEKKFALTPPGTGIRGANLD